MDDIKQIREALVAQGWRLEQRKGGHWMAFSPDPTYPPVVLPSTPSDWRSLKNSIARLRRGGFTWPPKGK